MFLVPSHAPGVAPGDQRQLQQQHRQALDPGRGAVVAGLNGGLASRNGGDQMGIPFGNLYIYIISIENHNVSWENPL